MTAHKLRSANVIQRIILAWRHIDRMHRLLSQSGLVNIARNMYKVRLCADGLFSRACMNEVRVLHSCACKRSPHSSRVIMKLGWVECYWEWRCAVKQTKVAIRRCETLAVSDRDRLISEVSASQTSKTYCYYRSGVCCRLRGSSAGRTKKLHGRSWVPQVSKKIALWAVSTLHEWEGLPVRDYHFREAEKRSMKSKR